MFLTGQIVKTMLLASMFTAIVCSNGFAFDLTRRHSDQVPKAADAFSISWLVEAQKQFDSDHSVDSQYPYILTGVLIVAFIGYGICRLGRTSCLRWLSSKTVQHNIAQQRFELRLICRWGGAIAAPLAHFRRISPYMFPTRSRLSPNGPSSLI